MNKILNIQTLVEACADDSFDDGIRIDAELEPIGGPGALVKPPVYEGGRYQEDKRWATPADEKPVDVIVIDNVPSQANRLEEAIRVHQRALGVPSFLLDLSEIDHLPPHLPKALSSLQFPHRNADGYLRDAQLDGEDFIKTPIGKSIFDATPWSAGALISWFPQALLYGFWQSHLGKKRAKTKHARAWVSEILGWNPATTDTKVMGLKGDSLNLSVDEDITSNADDRIEWQIGEAKGEEKAKGEKNVKLSEMGHGQVPFMRESEIAPGGISFVRITQRATVSFAQLRRISLGDGSSEADAAARALVVALGLRAHVLAFGRGFALRSGAELRVAESSTEWLGYAGDDALDLRDADVTEQLLRDALKHAETAGVPLDGWGKEPVTLTPKANLRSAIEATWPKLTD